MSFCGVCKGPPKEKFSPDDSMPKCVAAERRLLAVLPEATCCHNVKIAHSDGFTWMHTLELPAAKPAAGPVPLVFLPGYGTGAAIFANVWRQLALNAVEGTAWPGVARPRLLAVDPLGWYLSGRPPWRSGLDDVAAAEAWFAESLEAWREAMAIEVMDLFGHSIGGNLAATYAERYPQHVRKLVLLSPAGMPAQPPDYKDKMKSAPWKPKLMLSLWGRGYTPALALKILPRSLGYSVAARTAERWASGAGAVDVDALADYIYYGWSEGTESGEQALGSLLHPGAWGKRPLSERLPELKVKHVELIYGIVDWMDARHGNAVAKACEKRGDQVPQVFVQIVDKAGHYAHLNNVDGFCQALLRSLGRAEDSSDARCAPVPAGFSDRFKGENVPFWRQWENYEFGR